MLYQFSIVATMRTYSVDLHERNYPIFTGRFNAYIAVYGQLSGDFMGWIEQPFKMDITENDVPALLLNAEQFIKDHLGCKVSIW